MIYPLLRYLTSAFASLRSKKTTIEVLEDLEKRIKQYETNKQKNQSNERKYVGALMLYSIVVYIIGAIVYYLYLMPVTFSDRIKSLLPFLIMPIIIFFTRKFLKWYYVKRVDHFDMKLTELKEKKKKILEDVKEKETYKKAKEILERFSENETRTGQVNNGKKVNGKEPVQEETRANQAPVKGSAFVSKPFLSNNDLSKPTGQMMIRQGLERGHNANGSAPFPVNRAQMPNTIPIIANQPVISSFTNNERVVRTLVPRPFIPQQRTALDKVLDFLVGDGPNNRYALICKNCASHNGMALKEEFEYIAFRCAYCQQYNPPRKQKLNVPDMKQVLNESRAESSMQISRQEEQQPEEREVDAGDRCEEDNQDKEKVQDNSGENLASTDETSSFEKMETSENVEAVDKESEMSIEKGDDEKKND